MDLNRIYKEAHGTRHFIVLDLNEESDIESLGYGMLTNNDIQGLLKISRSHFNDVYQLRYDISEYNSLATILNQGVKWSFVLKVLKEILTTLSEMEDYLLDGEKLILQPEYIYVHNSNGSIDLVYLPLMNIKIESFDVFRLAKYILNNTVIEEDFGVSLSKVLNYLNSSTHKSFGEFLKLIINHDVSIERRSQKVQRNDQVQTELPPMEKEKIIDKPVENKPQEVLQDDNEKKNLDFSNFKVPSFSKNKTKAYLIRVKNQEKVEINKDDFIIGNNPQKSDYSCLSNEAISRHHANIIKQKSEYYIVDNHSTNKTYLNNQVLMPKKQYKLSHNDQLKFANELFRFELIE